ncbi:MAG: efflux RND transporter periplasmic adaptor subunit [Planctomycetes bacterium]|nr:efflux RND transporter periplasmic adaptor subunit [Planctomycetota bacterium]
MYKIRRSTHVAWIWIASACAPPAAPTNAAAPPVPVVIAVARTANVPVEVEAIGRAQTKSSVAVISQVSGRLQSAHFTEGQFVKKDELLFDIDPRPFDAELRLARADLAKDEAKVRQMDAELKRYESASKGGAVTAERVDQARADVEVTKAAAEADRARIESAEINLKYCEIRAPFDARAGAMQVFPGAIVKANETPAFVMLNQIKPIDVAFSVSETWLPDIIKNNAAAPLRVIVSIPDGPKRSLEGALAFMDNSVDAVTGTVRLKATFPNEDSALWPGQFVNVYLQISERKDAVLIPTEAVQAGQAGSFLFVVQSDETVEVRPVQTGLATGGESIIIKGLAKGERVVRDGLQRLVPGARVAARERGAAPEVKQ